MLCVAFSTSYAGLVTLEPNSLTDLLGPNPQALDTLMETDMSNGNLVSEVHSRAYTDNSGQYAYLYQVYNTGTAGNAPIEMFTVWPFTGADDDTSIGYLIGDIPAEFSSGGQQSSRDSAYVKQLTTGPQISFYYLEPDSVDVGEHSVVMYVMSALSPDEITGNVIDGSVGSGPVVGPIPEPATICLLGLGALGLLRKRRSA